MGEQPDLLTLSSTPLSPPPHWNRVLPSHYLLHPTLTSVLWAYSLAFSPSPHSTLLAASYAYSSAFSLSTPLHSPICLLGLQSGLFTLLHSTLPSASLAYSLAFSVCPPLYSALCLMALHSVLLTLSSTQFSPLHYGPIFWAYSLAFPLSPLPHGTRLFPPPYFALFL